MIRSHIMVCAGTGCSSSNSPAIIKAFEDALAKRHLEEEIRVVQTGCFGLCAMGPVVLIYPEGSFYTRITSNYTICKLTGTDIRIQKRLSGKLFPHK